MVSLAFVVALVGWLISTPQTPIPTPKAHAPGCCFFSFPWAVSKPAVFAARVQSPTSSIRPRRLPHHNQRPALLLGSVNRPSGRLLGGAPGSALSESVPDRPKHCLFDTWFVN